MMRGLLYGLVVVLLVGVLVECCTSPASAQETVYADKVAIGTFTATTSPLTIVGLPTIGAAGVLLRLDTGGKIGIGALLDTEIPAMGVPILFTGAAAPPSAGTRSTGTRLVLSPAVAVGTNFYDHAIGIDDNTTWGSVPTSTVGRWAFYANDTARAAAAVPAQTANHLVAELTGSRIFMPGASFAGSLGLFNRKWGTVYGGELNIETLVLQDTLASTNGRQIIGVSASVLTRDFLAVMSTDPWIHVKHPAFRAGDIAMLESAGKVEWLAVLSNAVDCRNNVAGTQGCQYGTGQDYGYSVTRNLDGSGLSTFYAGDTVLNTGAPGDGMLDLYAQRSSTSTGYPGYVLSDRPQAYYRMNGTTGLSGTGGGGDLAMIDASGNGYNGTVPGGLSWQRQLTSLVGTIPADPAFLTGGAYLPGGNGYFVVPRPAASPSFAGDLTVEFITFWDGVAGAFNWILYTGAVTGGNIGVGDGVVVLYFGNTAGTVNVDWQGIAPAGCTLAANAITHIALTRNQYSREVICYKNGVEVGRTPYAATPAPVTGTGDLLVGNSFPGVLDEVAIWNRVLPADRIAAHYGRRASNSTSTGNALAAGPSVAVRIRPPGVSPTYSNIVTRAVFGNLLGDYGYTTTTYGMALGDPAGANLVATGTTFAFRNGVTPTLVMQGDSFAMGSPVPTALNTGTGLWFSRLDDVGGPNATFRVGNPTGSVVRFDGATLLIREQGITWDSTGLTLLASPDFSGSGRVIRWNTTVSPTYGVRIMEYTPENALLIMRDQGDINLATGFFIGPSANLILRTTGAASTALLRGQQVSIESGSAAPVDFRMNVPIADATKPAANVIVRGGSPIQWLYLSGFSGTKSVGGCTMTFQTGILTASTCP